jgi:hypothetical protein
MPKRPDCTLEDRRVRDIKCIAELMQQAACRDSFLIAFFSEIYIRPTREQMPAIVTPELMIVYALQSILKSDLEIPEQQRLA